MQDFRLIVERGDRVRLTECWRATFYDPKLELHFGGEGATAWIALAWAISEWKRRGVDGGGPRLAINPNETPESAAGIAALKPKRDVFRVDWSRVNPKILGGDVPVLNGAARQDDVHANSAKAMSTSDGGDRNPVEVSQSGAISGKQITSAPIGGDIKGSTEIDGSGRTPRMSTTVRDVEAGEPGHRVSKAIAGAGPATVPKSSAAERRAKVRARLANKASNKESTGHGNGE